jgi:hypothetical protein
VLGLLADPATQELLEHRRNVAAAGRPGIVVFHGSFHGHVRRRGPDHVGHEVPSRDRTTARPLPSGVAVSPFPVAYRYGWDVETATDFALARWSTASSPCYLDAGPDHTLAGRCVASAAITATSSAMITSDQIG